MVPRQDTITGDIVRRPTQRNASIIALAFDGPCRPDGKAWRWWPSSTELQTHYLHDIGFLACSILLFSIGVFSVACVTALPPIYNMLDTPAKLNGAYWAPQVVGGVGFVISGAMFTIEVQEHWWVPAPGVLGWHIGGWNLVGGIVSLFLWASERPGVAADQMFACCRASRCALSLG